MESVCNWVVVWYQQCMIMDGGRRRREVNKLKFVDSPACTVHATLHIYVRPTIPPCSRVERNLQCYRVVGQRSWMHGWKRTDDDQEGRTQIHSTFFFDKNLATMRLPFNHLLEKNRPDVPKFRTSVERTNNCTVHILIEPAFLGEENGGLRKKKV